ncbi:hypothetical protein FA15DRAFT_659275 [Coprinopsis marcescibilis]|uniref:Uncharacterized protein n=1 Tax=Coprinopsis marcescibilis TaxID=230819 RepID=A0A5C3KIX7_COPMA|nr:hypothetical protein FA15DRAFT_659275 [Coprinopsis marcescibilis]
MSSFLAEIALAFLFELCLLLLGEFLLIFLSFCSKSYLYFVWFEEKPETLAVIASSLFVLVWLGILLVLPFWYFELALWVLLPLAWLQQVQTLQPQVSFNVHIMLRTFMLTTI